MSASRLNEVLTLQVANAENVISKISCCFPHIASLWCKISQKVTSVLLNVLTFRKGLSKPKP